jgi:hypothetical protein
MDALRACSRWLVTIATGGTLALAVWWSVASRPGKSETSEPVGCKVRELGVAHQKLAQDQQALDAKIEDVIGQLSFATTKLDRDAARERLDRLHGEAIDLRDRANWLQRLEDVIR